MHSERVPRFRSKPDVAASAIGWSEPASGRRVASAEVQRLFPAHLFDNHRGIWLGIQIRLRSMHKNKGNANSRFGRLKAVGAGLILVTVGLGNLARGVQNCPKWPQLHCRGVPAVPGEGRWVGF
jgi:hypothetical protein